MLELKRINKIYETDGFKQKALNDVSLSFRKCEFVSILGPSGSGKTTLLNIIGGLDDYTSGDLIIGGVSTKKYKDRDWDTYRNHEIGFVFQSYNLIPHQSILANVELALTLSGVSKSERRKRARAALKEVGLEKHINKRPNQLSGGQMQRVAIARALVNNPSILLADEPTGALDSKTSSQIMEMLKSVAEDRLVIMVTHNKELADQYSTRIINLKDGVIEGDSNPFDGAYDKLNNEKKIKKTSMSFKTALSLSLNNLLTKKGRTILTAFAGSIGIIGIALIMSLSNGVQEYINRVEEETLTSYPLVIDSSTIDMTSVMSEHVKKQEEMKNLEKDKIYSNDTITDTLSLMSKEVQSNNLEAFKKFVDGESNIKDYTTAVSYGYDLDIQLYKNDFENGIVQVNPDTVLESLNMRNGGMQNMLFSTNVWSKLFDNQKLNEKMYDVVSGRMPSNYNEVVLLVDEDNQITDYVLYAIGIKDQAELKEMYSKLVQGEKVENETSSYEYNDIIGLQFKMIFNTDYYIKENGIWIDKRNDSEYMKSILNSAETITITGIIKPSESSPIGSSTLGGILYTKELEEYVIAKNNEASIIKEQKDNSTVNILTNQAFGTGEFDITNLSYEQQMYLSTLSPEELTDVIESYRESANSTYESNLVKLGAIDLDKPSSIYLYAKDFEAKDEIKAIIEEYNNSQSDEANVIHYSDLVGILMSSVTSIVNMISYVLIGFVSISLVVSSIMIGIITYISVLERTKEIGILRAIGASKKDVSNVFNAETLIVGLFSGLLGIGVTLLLNIPINIIINSLADVEKISRLPLFGALGLILISVILTMIAGLIPSRMASKKDPVESLRSE